MITFPDTMRLVLTLALLVSRTEAFVPIQPSYETSTRTRTSSSSSRLHGYLDDLSKELYQPEDDAQVVSREESNLKEEAKDRYGVGDWNDFVEFQEFDGGGGQVGVAGDGKEGLDKE